jgi:hypothetical protein
MKKLLVLVPLLALLAVVPGALAFNFNLPANFTFAEDSSTTINLATYVSTTGTILSYTASNPDFLDINTPGTSTNISSITNWFGRESVTFTVTVNETGNITTNSSTTTIIVTPTEGSDDNSLIFTSDTEVTDETGDEDDKMPGDILTVSWEMENKLTNNEIRNIGLVAWLQDSSGSRLTDRVKPDEFDLTDKGDTSKDEFNLKLPFDAEDNDDVYLIIEATGEDENDTIKTDMYAEVFSITQDDNDIAVDTITISPDPAVCGQSVDILTDIWNVGADEASVKIHVTNSDLSIDVYSDLFDLDNSGDDREATITIPVLLGNAEPGNYTLTVTSIFNSGKDSETEAADMSIICSSYVVGGNEENGGTGTGMLTVETASMEGKQGQQVKFTAILKNTGATAAVYTFELTGISDWATGYVEPDTVTLAADATTDIFAYITPKTSASGDKTATLTVKSGGTTLETETLTVELPEKPTLSITSLGNLGDVDATTAALLIIGILIVVALIVAGKKRAAMAAVETYGKKRGRKAEE